MAELDLFRNFRRAVAPMSAEAERRASVRLKAAMEASASGRAARDDDRPRRRIVVVVVAAVLVVVAAASAFATVGELLFDPSKPRKESRTVDDVEFTFIVPAGVENRGWWENGPIVKVGESSSGAPEFRIGRVFISRSLAAGQAAEAGIFWTAFPDGGEAAPCGPLLNQDIGGSTVDLATAMTEAPGIRIVQRPVHTTVGGRPATHVVLKVRRDRGCDPGYFFTWKPSGWREGLRDGQCWGACWIKAGVGDTFRVWIVDVEGKRLVLAARMERIEPGMEVHFRADWLKAEREIASIIRSIRFR
jgi:hypothetical protein